MNISRLYYLNQLYTCINHQQVFGHYRILKYNSHFNFEKNLAYKFKHISLDCFSKIQLHKNSSIQSNCVETDNYCLNFRIFQKGLFDSHQYTRNLYFFGATQQDILEGKVHLSFFQNFIYRHKSILTTIPLFHKSICIPRSTLHILLGK